MGNCILPRLKEMPDASALQKPFITVFVSLYQRFQKGLHRTAKPV